MDKIITLNKFEFIAFIFLTIFISGASSIASNDFIKIIVLGVLVVYACLKRRPLFNNVLFYLLAAWCLINLISSFYFEKDIEYYQFIGKLILVYTAYMFLSCIKNDFWEKYENFLYKVVIISFIIYLFSLLIPSVFNSLTTIFRPFTNEIFYLKDSQKHYFYSFFFVYRGGDVLFRNNGFMWEPGAYAMILNILIAYNISKYGLRFTKHVKIYIIALLTTFSTAGYLSAFILLLLFLIQGKNIYVKILLISSVLVSFTWLINIDFLLPKIEKFIESTQEEQVFHQGYRELYEANRILSFKLLFDKFLIFPIGWGCIKDSISYMALNRIVTVNGLGNTLVTWGIFGFSFFLCSIGKFFYYYSKSLQIAVVFLLMVSISFFSNPIENNILLYILVLSPYVVMNNRQNRKYEHRGYL